MAKHLLLNGATADSNYPEVEWSGTGEGSLQIGGTFDGATVTIEGKTDDLVGWKAPAGMAYTAAALVPFAAGKELVRAVVSGKGASTNLSAILQEPERP